MKTTHLNKKGSALAISILILTVVITLSTAYVLKAVLEKAMADNEISAARALYIAEGACQAGLYELNTLINTNLLATVQNTNASAIATAAANDTTNNNQLGFLVSYAQNAGAAQLVGILAATGTGNPVEADYPFSNAYNPYTVSNPVPTTGATALNGGTYTYTIRLTAAGNPSSPSTDVWNFPFYYRIQGTGIYKNQTQKFTLNGYFHVQVQLENFAHFALFTNNQTYNGNPVWFTSSTNFSGPMFTNGNYNFAYNPSATFTSTVQQVSAKASFYNNGNPVSLNANANGTIDVPNFEQTFTRSATAASMPNSATESSMVNEATNSTSPCADIYLPHSSGKLTGGIYVNGSANITMSVNASKQAVYTITKGATTSTITVNASGNQTTVVGGCSAGTYTGQPSGVDDVGTLLYVNGTINSLSGTVQGNAQVLIASHNDTVIQNNILYTNYTPGSGTPGNVNYVPPSVSDTDSNGNPNNLLGILSWTGNVRVGTSAPNNVTIDASLMASQGVVTVDNYDQNSPRGTATILGGVISDDYGAFGTFNSGNGAALTGYGRNFVYDKRMDGQYSPPYFPTLNIYMASSSDINAHKFWQTRGF